MSAASRLNHAVTEVISQTPRRGKRGRFVKQVKPRAVILEALRQEYAQKLPEPILTAEEVSVLLKPPCGEGLYMEVGIGSPMLPRSFSRITPQRLTNSIFAVLLIALMFVDPFLVIKIGAGLYGLANGLVAWEGK